MLIYKIEINFQRSKRIQTYIPDYLEKIVEYKRLIDSNTRFF